MVIKNDHGNTFMPLFKADVILCMRRYSSYMLFNIGPYSILADNSIYLNHTAIQVAQ